MVNFGLLIFLRAQSPYRHLLSKTTITSVTGAPLVIEYNGVMWQQEHLPFRSLLPFPVPLIFAPVLNTAAAAYQTTRSRQKP